MKNIDKILELQTSYDDLRHAVDGLFLKLTHPGNVSMKSENSTIGFIFKKIDRIQKENSILTQVLNAAKELAHLHACEQEWIASGQPTPQQWDQAVNNLNDAIETVKQKNQ